MSLKVLLWMPSAGEIPGGHRVQMEQTAAHLRLLDVQAELSFDLDAPVEKFDIVHGFNETLPPALRRCRRAGVDIVVSSIYCERAYMTGQDRAYVGRRGALQYKISKWRGGLGLLRATLRERGSEMCEKKNENLIHKRVAFEMADLLLPNSRREAETLVRELKVTTPCHIVPNAVDHKAFVPPPAFTGDKWETGRSDVLYVGRFEPHKNQLGLIQIWNAQLPKLVLVGLPHPHHPQYYERCQSLARGKNIEIIPGVPHEQLPQLYQRARVHVLPSWFETTGLVSLEAALCGCNIVTTSRGYAREYFGDLVEYCDPSQPQTILRAVQKAHAAPPQNALRERILGHYTWEHTARATLDGYHRLRAQRDSAPSLDEAQITGAL